MPPFISTKYNNWLITYHITTASGDFMKALEILFYFIHCVAELFCYYKFKHYCWRSISLVYMLLTCKWRIAFMATKKLFIGTTIIRLYNMVRISNHHSNNPNSYLYFNQFCSCCYKCSTQDCHYYSNRLNII